MTKRTIPEIRARLNEIAESLDANGFVEWEAAELGEELRKLAFETIRNSPSRPRAKTKHPPLTPGQVKAVKQMARTNPNMHLDEIAKAFDVNPGRISEALRK